MLQAFLGQEGRESSMLTDSKSVGWEVKRAKSKGKLWSRKRKVILKSHFKSISRQREGFKIKAIVTIFKFLTNERCAINSNGYF